ncbi:MAG TPA: alpha/beta fold hydrolase [Thermoprotei archaeon]|nr:alpha/beta fold hydrolase [TACK group archaeon]HEV50964.1 alpha/beta fold hydrolase [Thermoprotei archaeon]
MTCEENPFKISSGDGWISGVAHKPSKKAPLVLMLHGYTGHHIEDHRLYVDIARKLCAEGIGTVRFDYRGHGDSSGEFEDFDIDEAIKDAENAFTYASSLDFVDKEKIGLLGLSMGGYIAVKLASEVNAKSIVLISPGLRVPMINVNVPTQDGYIYMDALRIKAENAKKVLQRMSGEAYEFAPRLNQPFLIIHAKDDPVVPFSSSEEFIGKLGSKNKHLLSFEKGGHVLSDYGVRRKAYSEIVDWFSKTL